ncbi:MAG: trypsin-like peptidase domain-containing protein [Melioribacteraceae bacterium]|nr:trypsin-like peptidase domain-containing protein [Melioribacteraceae bacterium]
MLSIISVRCTSDQYALREMLSDGEYDSQFPSKEVSESIDKIGKSVTLVNCLAFYKRFSYNQKDRITYNDLKRETLLKRAKDVTSFNRSASGTATIIGLNDSGILFLTNAHIVSFEDTIITYFSNELGEKTQVIAAISIKESQTNYVAMAGIGDVEILILDKKRDVALLGAERNKTFSQLYSVFDYKPGDSKELKWGDFVYVLSYPMHYKMLTRGIVSIPEDEDDFFLVDINVNRGSSGGIVLALRDGVPNFELVGMVSWVPAEKQNVLVPKSLINDSRYQIEAKYKGEMIIGEVENVKYGIAKVVSIEAVKKVLRENRDLLIQSGYDYGAFAGIFD